jgi:cyclohexyl-isocyanide hydratase
MLNRRSFGKQMGAALAASLLVQRGLAEETPTHRMAAEPLHSSVPSGPPQQIGMLLYPNMYALDLVGPHAFLSGLMNIKVHLLWKDLQPIAAANDLRLIPTTTLADCPKDLDVLFVPGGTRGTIAMMRDEEVLTFLADRGSRARYVTSVCTGSLVLGAAGLLKGYRATSHWNTRDILPLLGAIPVEQRVVEDRNRITGGGVTSGIDFGLVIASRMRDEQYARMLQLVNEYDPHPLFSAGTPKEAGPVLTEHLQRMMSKGHNDSRQAALDARKRIGLA